MRNLSDEELLVTFQSLLASAPDLVAKGGSATVSPAQPAGIRAVSPAIASDQRPSAQLFTHSDGMGGAARESGSPPGLGEAGGATGFGQSLSDAAAAIRRRLPLPPPPKQSPSRDREESAAAASSTASTAGQAALLPPSSQQSPFSEGTCQHPQAERVAASR